MSQGGPRVLRAGPLTLELADGDLRYIRLGDREVLRRVYVAVRDADWATIPIEVSDLVVEEGADAFAVDFVADHVRGPIHFRWKATIRGDAAGTVRFAMDGEVISTFVRNRIGICVLHPIDECAGRPCRVEHADGRVEDGVFPRAIAPHQPFFDIRAITHEAAPGVRAEVGFEGDVFEMEDQRNWCDASYKTYSTPLALPRPVEVKAGTTIAHAITVRLHGAPAQRPAPAADEILVSIGEGAAAPVPPLGTALPATAALTGVQRDRLRALPLSHLRADVIPSQPSFEAALDRACAEAAALALPIELALAVSEDARAELQRAAKALGARRPRLASLLIAPLDAEVTPPAAVALARELLGAAAAGAPIGAGTGKYFTEVNRNRAVVEGADVVFFPNSPQVHADDETTIVENLAGLSWIAETARSFAGPRRLALTPVTLKPRPAADPRQGWTFTAGWTACHVGRAARAGFHAVTYHEAAGPLGLLDEDGVRPVFHALADVADATEALDARSSAPLRVDVAALRAPGGTRLLLANLTRAAQTVRIPAAFAGGAVRRLNESTAANASRDPARFRAGAGESAAPTVTLAAHEYVRIDSRAK